MSDGNGGRTKNQLELDGNGNLRKRTETKTDADGNTQIETENLAPDAIDEAQDRVDAPSEPQARRDPLILDLDSSGVQTTNAATNAIHFDHDANGFAEATGWLNPADAFLAWDRNGNGTIDTGNELFGDQTTLRSGAKAASGLQALSEWDTSRDGQIDATDTRFADLRLWTDTNQDGVSQADELQTLADAGVSSISLTGTATNATADAHGNTLTRRSSFTRTDATIGTSGEVVFKRDTTLSIPVTNYNVTETIAAMPNLSGYGNLLDLHQALAQKVGAGDTAIAVALTTYLTAPDPVARDTALDTLLYTWANATGIAANARGATMDARRIAFLETVFGQSLGTPSSTAAVQWNMSWQQVREYYGASLLAQTSLKPLFDQIQYTWDGQSQTLKADLSSVESLLQDSLAADPAAGTAQLADFARAIKGLGAQDSVNYLALRETFFAQNPELAWAMDSAGLKVYDHRGMGSRGLTPHIEGTDSSDAVRGSLNEGDGYLNGLYGNDTIWGTARDEILINESGDSLLYGAGGADTLLAGAGNDTLDGGIGNDILQGEAGNDTYVLRRGGGIDRVKGWNTGDKVWLAASQEGLAVARSRDDLVIGFTDTADKLIVENYYAVAPGANEVITFRDGTTWTDSEIATALAEQIGTASADVLLGSPMAEQLDGRAGSDQIIGNEGKDTLVGGTEDDTLYGAGGIYPDSSTAFATRAANGDDTYIYRSGDGHDTIIDLDPTSNTDTLKLEGIAPDQVSLRLNATVDLVLDFADGGQVTVKEFVDAHGPAAGKIERVAFDDGTVWTDVDLRARLLAGTAQNDTLIGYGDADRIDGGAGVDTLDSRLGNDTLDGGEGDDRIWGGQGDDLLLGGEGNDRLTGQAGNDSFDGGTGNDTLFGGGEQNLGYLDSASSIANGDDTYFFGRGSGQDVIVDRDASAGNRDTIRLAPDVAPDDVIVSMNGDHLVLRLTTSDDTLTVWNGFRDGGRDWQVEGVEFADGTIWDPAELYRRAIVLGGNGGDILSGRDGRDDIVRGMDGNDLLLGRGGADLLQGGAGADTLVGGIGDDILEGNQGNDLIYTGEQGAATMANSGLDVIRFGAGDGQDRVFSVDGADDRVEFKAEVLPESVTVRRVGNDLQLSLGWADTLLLVGWATAGENRIGTVSFSDGTTWDAAELLQRALSGGIYGDSIEGFDSDDVLQGNGDGDRISGGRGNDTYMFYRGDGMDTVIDSQGHDTLVFADIEAAAVGVGRKGNDLVLTPGEGDKVTLSGWFAYVSATDGVQTVRFGNGVEWDAALLRQKALTGTLLDDQLTGYAGADTLEGLTGSDTLAGGDGDDLYVYRRGDGADMVIEATVGGQDTLSLPDLNPADVSAGRSGNDLLVWVTSNETDRIQIKDWYSTPEGRVERVAFANGDIWDSAAIKANAALGTIANDYMQGTPSNDLLDGGNGNDAIFGNVGDDVLIGGPGNDSLSGGSGSDEYRYGLGDGFDTITSAANDVLVFGPGITSDMLSVQFRPPRLYYTQGDAIVHMNSSLVIGIKGTDGGVQINATGPGLLPGITGVKFDDGSELSRAELIGQSDGFVGTFESGFTFNYLLGSYASTEATKSQLFDAFGYPWPISADGVFHGSLVGESIGGDAGANRIDARDGADSVTGGGGDDILSGGAGNDTIYGDAGYDLLGGSDLLAGGSGDDHLVDSKGDDVFAYNRGDGTDLIDGYYWQSFSIPTTADGNHDTISFGAGIRPEDVSAYIDAAHNLVVMTGAAGDNLVLRYSAESGFFLSGNETNFRWMQFIDASGQGRTFDLQAAVVRYRAALSGATASAPMRLLADADLEITSTHGLAGGESAIAYARKGDLFPRPLVINAPDSSGGVGMSGTVYSDQFILGDSNNQIWAGAGDDSVVTGAGNDLIDGGSGNDAIDTGSGSDIVSAGEGNDIVTVRGGVQQADGGSGNDIYRFWRGSRLTILDLPEVGGLNQVVLEDLSFDDIGVSIEGGALVLSVANQGGEIRIENFSTTPGQSPIARFVSSVEGRSLTLDQLLARGASLHGGAAADQLVGAHGDDMLLGQDGNDVLRGGAGNDVLQGGNGDDEYLFNLGDGVDTIVDSSSAQAPNTVRFGAGIEPWHLVPVVQDGVVVLRIGAGGDALRFDGVSPSATRDGHPVGRFVFANGSELSWNDVLGAGFDIAGTSGADSLAGTDRDDRIRGMGGDDTLAGGAGSDEYFYQPGTGARLRIEDRAALGEENSLTFGAGVNGDSLSLHVEAGELVLRDGSAGDAIVLGAADRSALMEAPAIGNFHFADGSPVGFAEIVERGILIDGTAEADLLVGTVMRDVIAGGAGNDRIAGGQGGDLSTGGAGDDTYVFNRGDGELVIDDEAQESEGNTLEFGPGITLDDMRNSLRFSRDEATGQGEFIIRLGDSGDRIRIAGFDPADAEYGSHGIEYFRFSDGSTFNFRQMVRNTFVIQGDTGDDHLTGTSVGDRLYGYEGADSLEGGAGGDVLTGGSGDDLLQGGAGSNTYIFDLGDGNDEIVDPGEATLVFGPGVQTGAMTYTQEADGLRVRYSESDSVLIRGWSAELPPVMIEGADGGAHAMSDLMQGPPQATRAIADQQTMQGASFRFELPADVFSDASSFSAVLSDGNPLPEWLAFHADAASGDFHFSGTPANGDVGDIEVQVIAQNALGNTASQTFRLAVGNVNDAPVVGVAIGTVSVIEDSGFEFVVPPTTFRDVDAGDSLSYGATLANSDPLPVWLSFDPATGTFSGMPTNDVVGTVAVSLTATDTSGATAAQVFDLTVTNTSDAPLTADDAGTVAEDEVDLATGNVLANDLDLDVGDVLSVTDSGIREGSFGQLSLAENGDWSYQLDAVRAQALGAGETAIEHFTYIASDGQLAASGALHIAVGGSNDAPEAGDAIEAISVLEDSDFTFVVPEAAFHDADSGDSLGYAATTINGDPLPAWLSFDPTTGTFSGTPTNEDVGTLTLSLTATDTSGVTAGQVFDLTVTNTSDAPLTADDAGAVIEDVVDVASGNVLANDIDPDVGDVLSITDSGVREGSFGQLSLAENGDWSYQLDAVRAQALGAGETAIEHFSYVVSDGQLAASGVLDVAVGGSNDAPVFTAALDPVQVDAGALFSWSLPTGAFVDADANDVLTYGASLADGSPLPAWLSVDAATGALAGTPGPGDAGEIGVQLTATDGGGETAAGSMTLTVVSMTPEGQLFVGTRQADTLTGTAYNDVFDGRAGADTLIGQDGDDLYLVADRKDVIVEQADGGFDAVWADTGYTLPDQVEALAFVGRADYAGNGNALGNLLVGNRGDNRLEGEDGDDLLLGQGGDDALFGGAGLDALDGGSGKDVLEDGDGVGFLAGGRGDDTLRLDGGADVIAFNRGDGKDRVLGGDGQNDTLSLGGGIRVGDIRLRKSGKDLILEVGAGDTLRFEDWYRSAASRTIATLQVATEPSGMVFDRYDFVAMTRKFDVALAANRRINAWTPGSEASRFRLGEATSEVAGGSLAARYAGSGKLNGARPETVATALAEARGDATALGDLPEVPLPPQSWRNLDPHEDHEDHEGHGHGDEHDWRVRDGYTGWQDANGAFLSQGEVEAAWQSWQQQGASPASVSPIDYALGWARLHDQLAGRLEEGEWGGAWCDRAGAALRHGFSNLPGNPGGSAGGSAIGLPGATLKPFEGLREGFDRLQVS